MKTRRILTALTSILAAACMMTMQFSALSVGAEVVSQDSGVTELDIEIKQQQDEWEKEYNTLIQDRIQRLKECKNNKCTGELFRNELGKYVEDSIITTNSGMETDIIKPDGTIDCLSETAYIKFYTNDDELNSQKFNIIKNMINEVDELSKSYYSEGWKCGMYKVNIDLFTDDIIEEIIMRASELEFVDKIEITDSLTKCENGYIVNGFNLRSDKTIDELKNEYSNLHIDLNEDFAEPAVKSSDKFYDYNIKVIKYENTPESYLEIKKLIENEEYVEVLCNAKNTAEFNTIENISTVVYEKENKNFSYIDSVKSSEEIIYGDADGNGEVELTDLTRISMTVMGDVTLEGTELLAADVNGDGEVDITDVAIMKQYVMGDAVKLGVQ